MDQVKHSEGPLILLLESWKGLSLLLRRPRQAVLVLVYLQRRCFNIGLILVAENNFFLLTSV